MSPQSVRQMFTLIEEFVVRYDMPMMQDNALGELLTRGAFRPLDSNADASALALRVGAYYCQMIRDDVYLDLASGRRHLLESEPDAEQLERERHNVPSRLDKTVRYILARWHNAKGRIYYRIGNYTQGRMAFETAVEWCSANGKQGNVPLWWCWGDMQSDCLRAQYEEEKQQKGNVNPSVAYFDRLTRRIVGFAGCGGGRATDVGARHLH